MRAAIVNSYTARSPPAAESTPPPHIAKNVERPFVCSDNLLWKVGGLMPV